MHDFLFFRVEKTHFKLRFSEILYVQAERKYVSIITPCKSFSVFTSISHIEKMLPQKLFCRIHRSYIISLEHIDKFDNELVYIGNRKLPIAEHYKHVLKDSVMIINCEIKPLKFDGQKVDSLLRNVNL